jgi:hypothetical protein
MNGPDLRARSAGALLLAIAIVALLATPALATQPKQAARAVKSCLVEHGWNARLADRGMTVNAEAPRDRDGYPAHPWFSIAFSALGSSEIRMGLNRRENAIATRCKQEAKR